MFLSVGAAVMGFRPQASPKVVQTELFQIKRFGLTNIAFKELSLSVSLCIYASVFWLKASLGYFQPLLVLKQDCVRRLWGGGEMQTFKGSTVGQPLTSPSHKRCTQTWPACQRKSLTLGSFQCLSSFPKRLRETCVRMSLPFSSIWAPSPLKTFRPFQKTLGLITISCTGIYREEMLISFCLFIFLMKE